MAKKSMKKLIAIVLSTLMIATSLPLSAIVAFADSSDIDYAKETMSAFVNMMDGTVYTNMSDAYTAYILCQERLDIYDATDYDKGVKAAAQNLETKMNNMSAFKSKQGTVFGSMSKDDTYTSDDYKTQIYKNLLYSPNVTSEIGSHKVQWGSSWTGSNGATFRIYYPTTVMLADGITDPTMAILGEVQNYYTATWSRNTRDYAMNMTASTANGLVFARNDGWVGYDNRKDNNRGPNFMWTYFSRSDILPYSPTGTQYYTHDGDSSSSWTNILKYTGDFATGVYSKTITPTFTYIGGNKDSAKITATVTGNNTPIYVINYKALLQAMNTNKSKITLKGSTKNYNQGGLSAAFKAFDDATKLDITSIDYSNPANGVTNAANQIKTAVDKLNNASITEDGTGYTALATALKNAKNDYTTIMADPTIADNYAEGAWESFKDAYENAGRKFENLDTTGYNDNEGAKALADDINFYKSKLVAVNRVDATAVITAIDNAEAVIDASRYFTAASYAQTNAVELVKQAKIAIWGSEETYGVSAKQLADSEEAQATVKAHADAIRAALMKLEINPNAVVIACGQSYNSVVAEAQGYLAKADDYSNSSKLQEAVNDATAYINGDTSVDASIANHAHHVIETYAKGVNDIVFAIQSLTPSFSKITDGTFATLGEKVTTSIDSERYPGYFMLDFSRYTGTIIFKTDHLAKDYDLPDAQFAFKTNRNFDQLLDSININADSELQNQEIISISSSQAITDNAKGWAMNGEQTKTYTGQLSMSNGGIDLRFHDMYCSGYKGAHGQIGYTKIPEGGSRRSVGFGEMATYDWTDDLTTTEGTEPFSGGVTAKSESNSGYGSTTINSKMTISTKATNSKLFNTDKSTGAVLSLAGAIRLSQFDTANSSSYIGMTYSWAHHPFNYWHGYSFDRAQYVQQIYVIDISSLLDLIEHVEALDATLYSNKSWADVSDALIAAKDEMSYSAMSADQIVTACDTRLQNLFDAMMALEAPATNTMIRDAIELTTSVYRNDESKCESTTWAAFAKAYADLYQDFMGKYSDKNVRDYNLSEQDIVDAAAEPLLEAYNNLVRYADFSYLNNAITLLIGQVENNKYTASQLDNLKTAIANFSSDEWYQFYITNKDAVDTYFNGGEVDEAIVAKLHTYYNSKNVNFTDTQAAIEAAASGLYALKDTLVKTELDNSVLTAAVQQVYDAYQDPDAWDGIDAAVQAIQNMNLYAPYNLYGRNVNVLAYETEADINAAVTEILAGDNAITVQKYSVTLTKPDGSQVNLGSFDYGTKVYIGADGTISTTKGNYDGLNISDWYYSYKSNTTQNAEKFVSTDTFLAFVVKGNTKVRMQNSVEQTTKVRINYVSSLNGKTYKIDYVDAGSTYTPNEHPTYHNYTFVNYTVDGAAVSEITADKDTTIVANFDYDSASETFTVILGNMGASVKAGAPITESGLKYNDLITCDATQINKIDSKDTAKVSYAINGETKTTTYAKRGTTAALKLTYWVAVDPEYIDAWMAYLNDTASFTTFASVVNKDKSLDAPTLLDSVRIIGIGDKLNYRVHENALIMALAKQDYDALNSNTTSDQFIVDRDTKGASAFAKENVIKNEGSFSIVSNYVLPEGASMVETGVLFQSNGDNTDTETALKFANVGKMTGADKKPVARMKSTQHTAGNQYVITIGSTKLSGTVKMRYAAYLIYEIDGVQYTYIQPAVTTSATF